MQQTSALSVKYQALIAKLGAATDLKMLVYSIIVGMRERETVTYRGARVYNGNNCQQLSATTFNCSASPPIIFMLSFCECGIHIFLQHRSIH